MTVGAGGTGANTSFDTAPVTATVSPTSEAAVGSDFSGLDNRVAGILANKSTTNWNAISAFMRAVVPWPGSDSDPGYVNLHYSMPNPTPTPARPLLKGMGWPYRDVDQFVGRLGWAMQHPDKFKDFWFCTSLQKTSALNKRGNAKAVRLAANALKLNAIWIDCDVKAGDPKHYHTDEEALKALLDFQIKVGLPAPSAIVHSGGGFHLYWISLTPLLPDEWQPYASGLKALLLSSGIKCDTGLTTDIARILRVPGTFNSKYNPPRPVRLLTPTVTPYDFAKLDFLKQYAGQAPVSIKPQHKIFADGVTMENFGKPDPAFDDLKGPGLEAGIDKFADQLLEPLPIFQQCGFLQHALLTGGQDYDQTLWMYSVLCSTFMENGNEIAHRISKGHPEYSADATQALYDRKLAERADRGIGYPSCSAIAGAGCSACATCPLLAKGKSPLNIRPDVASTVNSASGNIPKPEPSFVDPYAEFIGPAFPLGILPPTLAAFVDAEHRAMGADPAAIAMAALTAVAGAMHAETQVRAGDGWWEKPILWTSLIGQPSSMKSPVIERATKPLSRIDHERDKGWRKEHAKWAQTPNNKAIPCPPKVPRCLLNDATPEKVAEVLSRDPSGALMVHDELAGWLGGFERYNTGSSSRALYLSAWNGGPFLKDRVGRGKADTDAEIRVDNLALSILGGIQPDRLAKLGDLTSDGLLQRFLTVLMKPAKLGKPDHPVAAAENKYEELIRAINALPARNYCFTDEASEVRDHLLGYLHRLEQVDGFSASLIGAIGKLKGYFLRICLVLHVAKTLDPPVSPEINFILADAFRGLDPNESLAAGVNVNAAITRETAEAAKQLLLDFLLPHMIGLYDVVVNGGQERDRLRAIANFILASDKDRLRPSDFTAGVRTLRGEPEQKIREWVGRFCGMDWLSPEESNPGAPTKAWLVAPGLRDHFAERRKQVQAARAEVHAILKSGGSRKAS